MAIGPTNGNSSEHVHIKLTIAPGVDLAKLLTSGPGIGSLMQAVTTAEAASSKAINGKVGQAKGTDTEKKVQGKQQKLLSPGETAAERERRIQRELDRHNMIMTENAPAAAATEEPPARTRAKSAPPAPRPGTPNHVDHHKKNHGHHGVVL